MKKTYIYIDGFNLYHGCLKNTPYRWLNCEALCRELLHDNNEIVSIKYFTAPLKKRRWDSKSKVENQKIYWRALKTLDNFEIKEGYFQKEGKDLYREKQSDVNLATRLVHDAYMGCFDVAVVVSNDADFVEAVRLVREEVKKEVGVFLPRPRRTAKDLCNTASFAHEIRPNVLARCQFDKNMKDDEGSFHMPKGWDEQQSDEKQNWKRKMIQRVASHLSFIGMIKRD
ncbi:MAG: NYN domain-containing protein [Alphaproteobacteria bacterium]